MITFELLCGKHNVLKLGSGREVSEEHNQTASQWIFFLKLKKNSGRNKKDKHGKNMQMEALLEK